MKKNEIFELVVKAFGVYLLVLAIIALPNMLEGLIMLGCYLAQDSLRGADETAKYVQRTLQTGVISKTLGGLIKFVVYIIASVNFLRSGWWVKKLMGQKSAAELTD